jgi:ribonuclease G
LENLLVVNHTDELTRVAMLEGATLVELHLESAHERRIVGNIYKARVMRVLPGMNAAFVEAGLARTGFLYAADIVPSRTANEDYDDQGHQPERNERQDLRIETLVREGQEIIAQVAKEPIGAKGARLTCNYALPGVLSVFLPNVEVTGVSRRIDDPDERKRLREIGDSLREPGTGLILRTIAEGRQKEELRNEVEFLRQLWEQIKKGAEAVDAPSMLHEDMNLLLRAARDLICRRFDRLLVDSEAGAREVENFIRRFAPGAAQKVEVYTGTEPLFERYGIEYEIARAVQRKVWLKSGGHIGIDRTEAFTAVDVNSGKFTGKDDPEETILMTNLEAAREIAYQLRLRNIGGIIVIDFIDMKERENRQLVHDTLCQELRKDPARSRVLPMSELGLIEMTRKRTSDSLASRLTEACFYCEGKGYLKSPEMVTHSLFAKIRKEAGRRKTTAIHAHASPRIIQNLLEHYQSGLERLEKKHRTSIVLTERETFHFEQFEVFGET